MCVLSTACYVWSEIADNIGYANMPSACKSMAEAAAACCVYGILFYDDNSIDFHAKVVY